MEQNNRREKDLIWGLHSIQEALLNPRRKNFDLYWTAEGKSELQQKMKSHPGVLERVSARVLSLHDLNQNAEKWCKRLDYFSARVPSQVFLVVDPLDSPEMDRFYKELDRGQARRVVCLDQVTDAHNAAAIARSCSFFGIKDLVIPHKGSFGLSPNFYRISSGAMEHIDLHLISSLPKFLNRLDREKNLVVGLSEHADENYESQIKNHINDNKNIFLILGAEDRGLSHAVERCLDFRLSLTAKGPIKSLNVSVASALAMEKLEALYKN